MKLPRIPNDVDKLRQETVAMGGLNWSDRLREGDLRDSVNLSFRRWPYLTTRRARKGQEGYEGVTALAARGQLVAVRGTQLLLDGKQVGTVTAGEKQFAVVNTKLVIWPDMVYLDLETKTVKQIGAKLTLSAGSATFTENRLTAVKKRKVGTGEDKFWVDYDNVKQNDFPKVKVCSSILRTETGWQIVGLREQYETNLGTGQIVLMKESSGASFDYQLNYKWGKQDYLPDHGSRYAVVTFKETEMPGQTVVRYDVMECPLPNGSFRDRFKAGDVVVISGAGNNNKDSAVIKEVTDDTLTFTSDLFTPAEVSGAVTVRLKEAPALEFICESQNRLWGCEGNTIYASALGDPTNFYLYEGLSTDSYAVAVGSDGAFTGCVGYSEGVLFWKADCLHKVLGTAPSNYELHTYSVPGVQAGSAKSQVVFNDVLYYQGERGVYAYAGGTPSLLSTCFGERRLTDGVGGSDGEKYYLAAKEGEKRHLLVYDPEKGLWLREDGAGVRDFARLENRLYFADEDGKVWLIDGGGEDPDQEWMAQFTPCYETVRGRKRYSRLLLRLELPRGSWVIVEQRQDGGAWRECGKVVGRTEDVVPLRVAMNRCDKFELRLRGKGPCGVLSISREFSVGSEK